MRALSSLAFAGLLAGASLANYAGRTYSIDSSRGVYQMNLFDGQRTLVGTVTSNASTTAGFAFDRKNGILYLTSTGNDSLYTVNLTTWEATLVGAYGNSALVMHGIEYDNRTGKLYGASSHDGGIYEINKTTGAATLIGVTGLTSFINLVETGNSNFYCTNSSTDSFYGLDETTGAVSLIGPVSPATNPNGLAYNPHLDKIFMVCNSTDTLYTIDRATGQTTIIGDFSTGNSLGLVYLGAPMSFTVLKGELFEGDDVSLYASDDDRLSIFNDPETLQAEIEVVSSRHRTTGTGMSIVFETSVGRPGLALAVRLFNVTNSTNDFIHGATASATDRKVEFTSTSSDYVSSTGDVKLNFAWSPINDEDPSQDGWLHSLDLVSAEVIGG